MEQMTFEAYLISKKIAATLFEQGAPKQYAEFKRLFEQVHPKSFTAQKLFLINRIRRSYPLTALAPTTSNKAHDRKGSKPIVK